MRFLSPLLMMSGIGIAAHAADPVVQTPTGTYQPVIMRLMGGNAPKARISFAREFNRQISGGFRDGKMPIYRQSICTPDGEISLQGTAISGSFTDIHTGFVYTVTATVNGSEISGTFSGKGDLGKGSGFNGTVIGTLVSEGEFAKRNAFSNPKADWPCWSGPGTSFAATPTGVTLISDLSKAVLLWRSEDSLPNSLGTASSSPYGDQAVAQRTMGGGSSPIMANGKVFMAYYRASPDAPLMEEKALAKPKATFQEKYPWLSENPPSVIEKFRTRADDVVVCADAITGKTQWKTSFTQASDNSQDHKSHHSNCTPCYGDGKVFSLGAGGMLHALDAATGKPLWDAKVGPPLLGGRDGGSAPVYIGGVVVCGDHRGQMHGIDPASGKKLWSAPCGNQAVPNLAVIGGKEYAVGIGDGGIVCIEPTTGKQMWKVDGDFDSFGGSTSGDRLAISRNVGKTASEFIGYRMTTDKAIELWKLTDVAYHGFYHVPVFCGANISIGSEFKASSPRMNLIEFETGKLLKKMDVDAGKGQNNSGMAFFAEGTLFVRPDGKHGTSTFVPWGTTAETFAPGGSWNGIHPNTTSYHKPMSYPIVDGRLFIRGEDGVYCYDLRAVGK